MLPKTKHEGKMTIFFICKIAGFDPFSDIKDGQLLEYDSYQGRCDRHLLYNVL